MGKANVSSAVGLRNVVYAVLNEDESYGEVKPLIGAIDAKISTAMSTTPQYADDGVFASITSEGESTLTLQLADVPPLVRVELLGREVDTNGVVLDTIDSASPYVAVGFKSQRENKSYRYIWLYKGRFALGEEAFHTKETSATFQAPTITGTFINRLKDGLKKAVVDSDQEGLNPLILENWFKQPYESDEVIEQKPPVEAQLRSNGKSKLNV